MASRLTRERSPEGGDYFGAFADRRTNPLKGINDYRQVVEVFRAISESCADSTRSQDVASSAATKLLPRLGAHCRGTGIDVLMPYAAVIRQYSEKVPEQFKAAYLENVALPLFEKYAPALNDFTRILQGVTESAESKFFPFSKESIFGAANDQRKRGIGPLIEALPSFQNPQPAVLNIVDAITEMSFAKRNVFLTESGLRCMAALEKVPLEHRDAVLDALIVADDYAARIGALRRWDFLLIEGAAAAEGAAGRLLREPNGDEQTIRWEVQKRIDRWRSITAEPEVQGPPFLIASPEQIRSGQAERLKGEVALAQGAVDVLVHPLASEQFFDRRTQEFVQPFIDSTGRTWAEYRQYKARLENLLVSEDGANRLKVVLCDGRLWDQTARWLESLKLNSSVIMIPTRPDYPTPVLETVQQFHHLALARWAPSEGIPAPSVGDAKDSWPYLGDILQILGVRQANVFGEYTHARLAAGSPVLDSENNMSLIRPCCVESTQRNLLRFVPVHLLNEICFPHSTELPPVQNAVESVSVETILQHIPPSLRDAAGEICGSRIWSLITLKQTCDEIYSKTGDAPTVLPQFEPFVKNVERLAGMPEQFKKITAYALALSRPMEEIAERISFLNQTAETLFAIGEVCPTFATDLATLEVLKDCVRSADFTYLLSLARVRSAYVPTLLEDPDARKTASAYVARIISPVLTSDEEFVREGMLCRNFGLVTPSSGVTCGHLKDSQKMAFFLRYTEELRLLARQGILRGNVLYIEAGADVFPALAMAIEGAEENGSRLMWLSANCSEIRGCMTLLEAVGHRSILNARTPAMELPLSRNLTVTQYLERGELNGDRSAILDRIAHGSEAGGPIEKFLGHNHWEREGRGIMTPAITFLTGHSSDTKPIEEYMNGVQPDCVLIKGVETWVFCDSKPVGEGISEASRGLLYEYLNRIVATSGPGTFFAVSALDPHAAEYFSEHPQFTEIEPTDELRRVHESYDDHYKLFHVKITEQNQTIGEVELAPVRKQLPNVVLTARGNFRVFRRTGAMPRALNIIDEAAVSTVAGRDVEKYRRLLQNPEKLIASILIESSGASLREVANVHILEELLKIEFMVNDIGELGRFSGSREDLLEEVREQVQAGRDAILKGGVDRFPLQWRRLRNLEERVLLRPESVDTTELELLRTLAASQLVLEDIYFRASHERPAPRVRIPGDYIYKNLPDDSEGSPEPPKFMKTSEDEGDIRQSIRERLLPGFFSQANDDEF